MKINEAIRMYRKEQNLTQEQIANYLGVTAPAVNKWENGVSYPDITLLAPLARILKTDIDTLLSFHEELTDKEINQLVKEISEDIKTQGSQHTFDKVFDLIKTYPKCDKLILYLAQIMNAYLQTQEGENKKYKKQILAWFEVVAFSNDKELANMAVVSLSQHYMNENNYEDAQKLLDQIPQAGYDKRIMQANLYSRQYEYDKAYEIHESMIYQNANALMNTLSLITHLKCNQERYDEAYVYANLSRIVAEQFDLGRYVAGSAELLIALELKKKEDSLRLLKEMIDEVDDMFLAYRSPLYQHMKFKEQGKISTDMRTMLFSAFEQDDQIAFLREEPDFQKLLKKMLPDA